MHAFNHSQPRQRPGCALAALAALVLTFAVQPASAGGEHRLGRIPPDPALFTARIDHRYLPLVPGTTFALLERLGRHVSEIELAVLDSTRVVDGVTCRVVRERVREKGEQTQENHLFYAQDEHGNVWVFGEDSREFVGRGHVDTDGTWEAGIDGAQAGIVMPADVANLSPIRGGWLAGEVEDMSQIVAVVDSVSVPAGAFVQCLKQKEWSMLESGTDKKWYAPGIGLVRAVSAAKEITVLLSVAKP